MKIAVFVTDFPIHLVGWLCDIIEGLVAREQEVDLFLYKAGDPPRFKSGVRTIQLPEGAGFATEVVPASVLDSVRRSAGENRYDACIGFESRALLLAQAAAKTAGCLLVHHCFELYEPTYPGVWKDEFAEIKRLEAAAIREMDLFLIQDSDREKEYYRILGTDNRPRQTMYLPVALPRLSLTAKPRYWHQRYHLHPDTRVIFYMGQLSAARFVDRMIIAAQSFRPDQRLVVHGPFFNNTAALEQLANLDSARRVIFSTEIMPWDQLPLLSASADMGLVFYRRQYVNEFTTGRSSDKLARYLQSGIPVLCSDFPSFRREIDRFGFGECCSDFSQIPELVNRICDRYAEYQKGAQRAFEEVYHLDPYLDRMVSAIRQLRRLPEIRSQTTAFGPRSVPTYDLTDPNRTLLVARRSAERGDYNASFDMYEKLAAAFPDQSVEILAEAYDQYQKIPNPDRYSLYQARHFDFGIRPGDTVLDIGSGNVPFHLATHLADLTLEDDRLGRAGAPFKYLNGKPVYQCNIERMPFADKQFDFAYCSHVLEHVGDPAKACRELMRIARRGYIECPSPGKDLWLDTIAVSNHRWAVENIGGKLVFREYTPTQRIGLQSDILRDMHCSPQTPREKAFSALVYLKADRMNTMLLWEDQFAFEVYPAQADPSNAPHPTALAQTNRPCDCPLSIIVTVYQKEAYIGYVIDGIVKNTTSPFELVMVYDGCTDRSEQVVDSVLAADKGQMRRLTVVHTPDVNEVRANNAGMRAAGGEYWILVQDDMQITERGWEKRLLYPILQWSDVFAVSANKAHSFSCAPPPNPCVEYACTVSAQREVFQIRDAVNRGPLALRADTMRRLNYFDEAYAPLYFDDMDLCVRAYQELKRVSGVYAIGYRNLPQTVGANQYAVLSTGGTWRQSADKNRRLFWQRYHDHFQGHHHDEDRPCVFGEPANIPSEHPTSETQQPTIPVVRGLPMIRLGTEYGGWTIDPDLIPAGSTIISAGVGEDISFDRELIARKNCMVVGIDPTEKAKQYIQNHSGPRFRFLPRALAEKGRSFVRMYRNANPDHVSDSIVSSHQSVASGQFYDAQTVCLDDLLRELPNVSLLKMDVEGAEYSILSSVANLDIPQICVEFHHFCTGYTIEDTLSCIEHLGRMGYVVAHADAKAAPLQQVTFVHSRHLPKHSGETFSRTHSMVGCT